MSFIHPHGGTGYAFGEKLPSAHVNTIWSNVSKAVDGIGGGTYTLTANLVFDDATHFISLKAGLVPAGGNLEIFGILGVFSGGVLGFDSGASASFTTGSVLHFDSGSTVTGTMSPASGSLVDFLGGSILRGESGSQSVWKSGSATYYQSGADFTFQSGSTPKIQTPLSVEVSSGASGIQWKTGTTLTTDSGSTTAFNGAVGLNGATTLNGTMTAVGNIVLAVGAHIRRRYFLATADSNHAYKIADADVFNINSLTGTRTYTIQDVGAGQGDVIEIFQGDGSTANVVQSDGTTAIATIGNVSTNYKYLKLIHNGSALGWTIMNRGDAIP